MIFEDTYYWVSRQRTVEEKEPLQPKPIVVEIGKKADFTDDMLFNPQKYHFIYKHRCSVCGNPFHNARRHKNIVKPTHEK